MASIFVSLGMMTDFLTELPTDFLTELPTDPTSQLTATLPTKQ